MSSSREQPSIRTRLAYERTRVASERTLMAWTRTAVSLVAFGFTIPKTFRYLEVSGELKHHIGRSPVNFGLMLIGLGTLSLAAGMLQHVLLLRRIDLGKRAFPGLSLALATATCMVAFGVYAFANIVARH